MIRKIKFNMMVSYETAVICEKINEIIEVLNEEQKS